MEHSRVQKEDINRTGMQSLIFNITINVIQSEKDCFFNKMSLRQLDVQMEKIINLNPSIIPCTKINLKLQI